MKANKFFLGLALVGAILTGCNNNPDDTVTGPTGDAYVSVQISMASTAGTRAVTDGGFAVGDEAEQLINSTNSIFLFYDAQGKWVTSGQLITEKNFTEESEVAGDGHTSHADNVNINALKGSAYIVLSGPDEDLRKSTQVLTVVNYHDVESLKQLDLLQVLAKTTTTATDEDPANAGFLMTTSAYVSDGVIVNTTAIDSTNICMAQAEAKNNPVKIYIERASAKAEFTTSETDDTFELETGDATDKDIVIDGEITKVQVKITGWTLNNVNEETYLVKQLDSSWIQEAPYTGWNWADNFRSFWAKGTDWDNESNVQLENVYQNTVYTYNQANKDVKGIMYCYENTVENPNANTTAGTADPNVNTVLIAAEFNIVGDTAKNFYRYGGVYYTEENYKNLILKQIQDAGYDKDVDGNDYGIDDLTISSNGTLAGIQFTIKNAYTEQLKNGKDVVTYVNSLSYVTEVEGYAGGKCYYQIPVEHTNLTDGVLYGMVRNHWYKINVSSIKRIGEAVYNPNVVIPDIPEKTDDYYLAAEIHVLSWHIVNQDVEL